MGVGVGEWWAIIPAREIINFIPFIYITTPASSIVGVNQKNWYSFERKAGKNDDNCSNRGCDINRVGLLGNGHFVNILTEGKKV
jgi:hypothetical protein